MKARRYPFRSRRLRKKYRQKEFAEYGFEVSGSYFGECKCLWFVRDEVFINLAEMIEKDGFYFGGGYNDDTWGFTFGKYRGSITLEDKNKILEEIKRLEGCGLKIEKVSDLIDLWYENRDPK